jgi:hypothetical protein
MKVIDDKISKCGNYRVKVIDSEGEAVRATPFLDILSDQHEDGWMLSGIVVGYPASLFYSKITKG